MEVKDEEAMIRRSSWDDSWSRLVVERSRHLCDGQAIVTDFQTRTRLRDCQDDENTVSRAFSWQPIVAPRRVSLDPAQKCTAPKMRMQSFTVVPSIAAVQHQRKISHSFIAQRSIHTAFPLLASAGDVILLGAGSLLLSHRNPADASANPASFQRKGEHSTLDLVLALVLVHGSRPLAPRASRSTTFAGFDRDRPRRHGAAVPIDHRTLNCSVLSFLLSSFHSHPLEPPNSAFARHIGRIQSLPTF